MRDDAQLDQQRAATESLTALDLLHQEQTQGSIVTFCSELDAVLAVFFTETVSTVCFKIASILAASSRLTRQAFICSKCNICSDTDTMKHDHFFLGLCCAL